MGTWENYKNQLKTLSDEKRRKAGEIADIVSSIIKRRKELGISQFALAERCGMAQPSIARIETLKTIPKLDTLLKIMQALNLKLTVDTAG